MTYFLFQAVLIKGYIMELTNYTTVSNHTYAVLLYQVWIKG